MRSRSGWWCALPVGAGPLVGVGLLLALGVVPLSGVALVPVAGMREAALVVSRPAAAEALVPGLDQTRTVGLVVLPGTVVGTLLGGASPVQAGAVQVLVLVALLAVQAVAVVLTVELLAREVLRREPPHEAVHDGSHTGSTRRRHPRARSGSWPAAGG